MSDKDFLLSIAGMFSSEEQQAMAWSDADIDAAMLNRWQGTTGTTAIDSPSYRVAVAVACQVRNELAAQLAAARQRIVELETERWVPMVGLVRDELGNDNTILPDGRFVVINAGDEDNLSIALPPDVRLCRRQRQEGEAR